MLDPDYSKSPAVRAAMALIAALTVAQPAPSLTSALEPGRREGETSAAAVAQDIMKALAEAPKAQVRTISVPEAGRRYFNPLQKRELRGRPSR